MAPQLPGIYLLVLISAAHGVTTEAPTLQKNRIPVLSLAADESPEVAGWGNRTILGYTCPMLYDSIIVVVRTFFDLDSSKILVNTQECLPPTPQSLCTSW